MNAEEENLDFVTIKGLIKYGEALAQRSHMEGIELPPTPPPTGDRPRHAEEAMAAIRGFVQNAQAGFSHASAYRSARHALIQHNCVGVSPSDGVEHDSIP